jgi:hypothetical protein
LQLLFFSLAIDFEKKEVKKTMFNNNWYPILVILAVAFPSFDVLQAKMGECPPTKQLAVNACKTFYKIKFNHQSGLKDSTKA